MYHQDKKGFYKKHDNVDFELIIIIIIITSDIEPISIVIEEKGYDSEVKTRICKRRHQNILHYSLP
jgi:hypothetical protein